MEYKAHESLKLEALRRDLPAGLEPAERGELMDGETAFQVATRMKSSSSRIAKMDPERRATG